MNDFAFLAEHYLAGGFPHHLLGLSLRMAGTPCGPLRKRHGFEGLAADVQGDRRVRFVDAKDLA